MYPQGVKQLISDLSSRHMDRRTFLKTMGIGVLTVVGVKRLLHSIHEVAHPRIFEGYSAGEYSGFKLGDSSNPIKNRNKGGLRS